MPLRSALSGSWLFAIRPRSPRNPFRLFVIFAATPVVELNRVATPAGLLVSSLVIFVLSAVRVASLFSVMPIAPSEILELPFLTPPLTILASVLLIVLNIALPSSGPPCAPLAFELSKPATWLGRDQGVIEVDEVVDGSRCRCGVLRHGQRLRRAGRRANGRRGEVQRDTLDR